VSWLLGFFFRRISVEGSSMVPAFVPGERLTVFRRWRPVRVGDVVVLRDPRGHDRWLLKRCVARNGNRLELRGDNTTASTDSRDFGLVVEKQIKWIVPSPDSAKGHK
jgi:nickel-type superoxide dismutase maturation protease